jgi:hypothetical protein
VGNSDDVSAAADFKKELREAGPGARGQLQGQHYLLTTRSGGRIRRLWKWIDSQREISVVVTYDAAYEAYFDPMVERVFSSINVPGPAQ